MSAVADWGFPRRDAPTPTVGTQTYYFGNVFPPNCMKLKKNWTGAYIPNAPPKICRWSAVPVKKWYLSKCLMNTNLEIYPAISCVSWNAQAQVVFQLALEFAVKCHVYRLIGGTILVWFYGLHLKQLPHHHPQWRIQGGATGAHPPHPPGPTFS